jgi:hypothetical protein
VIGGIRRIPPSGAKDSICNVPRQVGK